MATDHQMTVARTARSLPPAQISKSTRQVVPAFLQKLYEMVNDPKNHDLIRWSEAGDSFFVLDHERFAHDVLGRWFKHRNFSSFVRQLNMYGFHKIPHLQQGVLKSDAETEFWNFAHANFHRGQPDMLCLIQRKKTSNQSAMDDPMDIRDGQPASTGTGAPPSASANVQGQLVDVQAIISGIAAIKRHQTTISSELQELKRSNQLLWRDSMDARAKYQKQQDTINRIVKFLAGVFGTTAHPKEDSVQNNTMVVPRRHPRFMIEDTRRDGKGIVEMEDLETLPTIETPISEPSPAASEYIATPGQSATVSPDTPTTPTMKRHEPQPIQPTKAVPADIDVRAVTPSRLNPAPVYELDHRLHGVLNQLTPTQIQQLVAQLSSQNLPDPTSTAPVNTPPLSTPTPSSTSTSAPNANHLTQYAPSPFDFSSFSNPPTNSVFAPSFQLPSPSEGLISFNPYDIATQPETVERHWEAAEDIEKDVNALNTSIHQLIQTFGLDPNLVEVPSGMSDPGNSGLPGGAANMNVPGYPGLNSGIPSTSTGGLDFVPSGATMDGSVPMDLNPADFDFDAFFNTLPNTTGTDTMDFTDSASTAFLDEVPSPASTASPMNPLRPLSPEASMNGAGRTGLGSGLSGNAKKRKSDVSELEGMGLPQLQAVHPSATMLSEAGVSPTLGKTKRRKEK